MSSTTKVENKVENKVEKSWITESGHNAICYANGRGYGDLTFCGKSYWDKNNDNIWIGFDCSHYGDLTDPSISFNPFSYLLNYKNSGTIKDLDFVINECEKIGKQLNELKIKEQ